MVNIFYLRENGKRLREDHEDFSLKRGKINNLRK